MFNSYDYLDDYICGNKFINLCDYKITTNDFNIDVEQLKKDQIVFVKTDKLKDFFDTVRNLPYTYVIITHNSDHNIDEERYSWKPSNVKLWFAQNVLIKKEDLIPIPIGLENPGVACSGNIDDFINNLASGVNKRNLLYVNFSNGTNPNRSSIKEFFRDKPWSKIQDERINFKEFLQKASSYEYVLSPPGNGSDTHRFWESLYCNSIPVAFNNIHNDFFSSILPILIVESKEQITDTLLKDKMDYFKSRIDRNYFTMKALQFSYWKNLILTYSSKYIKTD